MYSHTGPAPTISVDTPIISIFIQDSLKLNCSFTSIQLIPGLALMVAWILPDDSVITDQSTDPETSVFLTNNNISSYTSTLSVNSVTLSHGGTYLCTVSITSNDSLVSDSNLTMGSAFVSIKGRLKFVCI